MQTFKTHTGEIISGERLKSALNKVADDYIRGSIAVREENSFASHVTEKEKEDYIFKYWIAIAEEVRQGNINSFTTWQRVDTALTGECIAFLP